MGQDHRTVGTRWSVTAFVLIVTALFCVFAFRTVGAALALFAAVTLIVLAVHGARRIARRGGGA